MSTPAYRLLVPLGMATLLLLSLAYWWLDNVPHEIFGAGLFALIAWHIANNRSWFANILGERYNGRRVCTVVLHLALGPARDEHRHIQIGVCLPAAAEQHLTARNPLVHCLLGDDRGRHPSRPPLDARDDAVAFASGPFSGKRPKKPGAPGGGYGVWSARVLDVWGKLMFTYSLDFWDFTASVTPFFGHWAGVVALPAIATHYLVVSSLRTLGSVRNQAGQ